MKRNRFGFLRKKTVKRGIKVALCLLLALLATASDALPILPPTEVAEAADDPPAEKALRDHTLYKWTRVSHYTDISHLSNGWTPILISYQWTYTNKDKSKTTKEYFLKTNGNYLTKHRYIDATEWGPIASDRNYPTLNGGIGDNFDKAQNTFWTVDDPLTDLYVFCQYDYDVEYGDFWTFELGRNIDWSKGWGEDSAGERLVCQGSDEVDFGSSDSEWFEDAEDWRELSFDQFLFISEGDEPSESSDRPAVNLKKGEFRIYAEHDNARDSCLYPSGSQFHFGGFSSFDWDGKFSVWVAQRINLPTFEAVNAMKNGRIGCADSLQDLNRFTPDVTVYRNQLFKISDDVRIATNAVMVIQPGATVTIDATLYNDGTIINYGTIFIREGGCIRPCDPYNKTKIEGGVDGPSTVYDEGHGRLICSGKYNGKLTGEGNLIMFKQSAIVFGAAGFNGYVGGSNMFIVRDGASVELNGMILSPNFIQLIDSDFHIRESGYLVCQLKLANRFTETKYFTTEFSDSSFAGEKMNTVTVPMPMYRTGSYQFVKDGKMYYLTDPDTDKTLAPTFNVNVFNEDISYGVRFTLVK